MSREERVGDARLGERRRAQAARIADPAGPVTALVT